MLRLPSKALARTQAARPAWPRKSSLAGWPSVATLLLPLKRSAVPSLPLTPALGQLAQAAAAGEPDVSPLCGAVLS
jgi:hypothetical protein